MIKIFSLTIVLLFSFVSSVPLDTTNNEGYKAALADLNYRLPDKILPSLYNIKLTPHILPNEEGKNQFSFEGNVSITISTKFDNVKEIVLHSTKSLIIESKKLVDSKGNSKVIADSSSSEKTEKLTLQLEDPLVANENYVLIFTYNSNLADDMHGFYKSYYLDKDKKKVWLASTQFQPVYARKVFPCFDEPKFKAKFELTISHDKSLNAVSNMAIKEVKDVGSRYESIFPATPEMSTYLLAFLISDFKERKTEDDKFLVIARKDAFEQTKYSFDIGPKLLNAMNNYTNLEYNTLGNDKMHLAAIPDFKAGAMENWGLLTYRERALLYDNEETTSSAEQYIANIISHEQAHMWFGDLVTCDWWSYTWLNEGFARYFQYFTTHDVIPAWEMDKQFVVDQIHTVLKIDSLNTTNPMTDTTVETPDDIIKIFNSISYNKGATIIRMFIHSLGADKFKTAIRKYLDKQKYKTSLPTILFNFLEAEWNNKEINMTEYFTDWTEQVGYPVVTIKVSDDRKSAEISQDRFLLQENAGDPDIRYIVPFTFTTNDNKSFDKIDIQYLKKSNNTKIEFKDKIKWIIGNLQQIGYYRVNYDTNSWHEIHHALLSDNWDGIHEINRAQLVDDLFNFGTSGLLEFDLILDILDYLKTETNYLPWKSALNGFETIAIRLGTDTEQFTTYIKMLMEKVFNELGFEHQVNETRLSIYNREQILYWSCKYGLKDCVSKSKELFESLRKENKSVPINIRSSVYCTVVREGDLEDFDFLLNKYNKTHVATEQVLILSILGCAKNKTIIEKYYNLTLSGDIRLQDKTSALTSIIKGNPDNPEILFDLIIKDYKQLSTALGGDQKMAAIVAQIATRLTTKSQKEKLEKFLNDNKNLDEAAKKILETSKAEIEVNLEWSSKTLEKFKQSLKKKFTKDKNNNSNKLNISYSIIILAVLTIYFNK